MAAATGNGAPKGKFSELGDRVAGNSQQVEAALGYWRVGSAQNQLLTA